MSFIIKSYISLLMFSNVGLTISLKIKCIATLKNCHKHRLDKPPIHQSISIILEVLRTKNRLFLINIGI